MQLSNEGDPSDVYLGASSRTRLPAVASWDLHFRNDSWHFSPSLYYLGFGAGFGYLYRDLTAVTVSAGISFLPVSFGTGLQISQRILPHTYLNYGFNYADFHRTNCDGFCTVSDDAEKKPYHHLGLGVNLFDYLYVDAAIDLMYGPKRDVEPGISITYFADFKAGKLAPPAR